MAAKSRGLLSGNLKSEMTTTTATAAAAVTATTATATAAATAAAATLPTCNVVGHLINKWPNANEIDRNSPKEYKKTKLV